MDLATLGIAINSKQAVSAAADLAKLSGAAHQAEAAAESLAGASNEAAGAMRSAGGAAGAEAMAVGRSVTPLRAAAAAHQQVEKATKAGNFQRTNLIAQLNDIGVSLASGQALWMVAIQQGSQISAIYSAEEGGIGRAFRETGKIAVWLATKLLPLGAVAGGLGILFEGWTRKIQASGHAHVTFGNVLVATWQLLLEKAKSIFSSQFGGVWEDFMKGLDKVVANTNREINGIIGAFVGTYEAIKASWSLLPAALGDLAIRAAQGVINTFEEMAQSIIARINGMIASINGALRNAGIDKQLPQLGTPYSIVGHTALANPYVGAAANAAGAARQAYAGAQQNYVGNALDAIGDRAQKIHDEPTKKQLKEMERQKKAYDEITQSALQYIDTQDLEARSLGMTSEEVSRLRNEQDLLNKAADEHIKLTPKQTEALKGLAAQMAEAEDRTSKLKAAYEFTKETFQGFFSDLSQGLQDGQGFWSSFASAATNAMNKILDKLLEFSTNSIFDQLIGGGGSSGSIFSTIASSIFGGGGGSVSGQLYHSGGIVGAGAASRNVPLAAFAGAQRFHGGGYPGLRDDEVPAILQKGERVLRRGQGGGGGDVSVTVNNAPSGTNANVRTSMDDRGLRKIVVDLVDERVPQNIGNGSSDGALAGRFGARPRKIV